MIPIDLIIINKRVKDGGSNQNLLRRKKMTIPKIIFLLCHLNKDFWTW